MRARPCGSEHPLTERRVTEGLLGLCKNLPHLPERPLLTERWVARSDRALWGTEQIR
jgi:hypothetical protein